MELEQKSHLGVGGLFQGADLSPPGPVHQDIEATKAFRRLVDNLNIGPVMSQTRRSVAGAVMIPE
jgi:hypothetical protein